MPRHKFTIALKDGGVIEVETDRFVTNYGVAEFHKRVNNALEPWLITHAFAHWLSVEYVGEGEPDAEVEQD